jgi:ubiquinone/menaquinone biosynthesis C-methylase UbiE
MTKRSAWGQISTLASDRLMVGAYRLGILPHPYQLYSALKIYELETVLSHLSFPSEGTIIDLCCGTGIQSQLLASKAPRVIGIDNDRDRIRDARWHLRFSRFRSAVSFVVGRAEALPLPMNAVDAVVCLCAIEHLVNPEQALREVVRVLKPGGRLYLTADSLGNVESSELKALHQRSYAVCHYFDVKSLTQLLEISGFLVEAAFPLLCSEEAIEEMKRCMAAPHALGPITTRRLLSKFRRRDRAIRNSSKLAGLFVFASARRV